MKRCKKDRMILKKIWISILVATMIGMPLQDFQVNATEAGSSENAQNTSSSESAEVDANGALGKNTDIGIEVTKSITGKAGKSVKIAFNLKSADANSIKLKSVYPVIDDAFPFETSGDAYKVVTAGGDAGKQAKLSASFKLKSRSDIESGYHSVRFIGEYTKSASDGTIQDYYVIKTINIYFEDESSNDDSGDDNQNDDDSADYGGDISGDNDEAVSAPKLLITGYDTDPATIMAGEAFNLTIHIQNTSKTTPVCNGKFLIGNEAGTFLPTSGSSAVFIEKIPAGETGDLKIELKTAADVAQKNYILVVKGDFDDGKGNTFTSSDNLSIPVQQEVRLGITDVTMTPEMLAIDGEGNLMFTINNQGNAGVYNVTAAAKDDAVTGEESYIGNIAASSSAYATLNLTGVKDNAETGTINVVITYEDSSGTTGTFEQAVTCMVSEDAVAEEDGWESYEDEEYYDEESGLPVWLIVLLVLICIAAVVAVIIIVVKKKKKRMAQLLEDDDDLEEDLLGEDDSEEALLGEDGKTDEDF